jgi:gas vesicle protein
MNSYFREIRTALENLGIVSRPRASWGSGFFVGAGLGVVAGVAAAAMLTPKTGKEVRKLVGSRAKTMAKSAEHRLAAMKTPRPNGASELRS